MIHNVPNFDTNDQRNRRCLSTALTQASRRAQLSYLKGKVSSIANPVDSKIEQHLSKAVRTKTAMNVPNLNFDEMASHKLLAPKFSRPCTCTNSSGVF